MANLAKEMDSRLPEELSAFLRRAGQIAAASGENLYLVGGVVRDLLLGKANTDIDLVVEGDAAALAARLLPDKEVKITYYKRFNTAKIAWRNWSIDIAAARREHYSNPGALPSVSPSLLGDDLWRRDFCINSMAASLNPADYGELTDPCGGEQDLKNGFIRVLHPLSFSDDATRIWRAIRYEQRLGFHLEEHTFRLLQQDIPMLATISGERIRYEIECILAEDEPEKVFRRATELGVLQALHPKLKGDGWLKDSFTAARNYCAPDKPPAGLYMALLTYRLTAVEKEVLSSRLRLTKALAKALKDTTEIKGNLKALTDNKPPSAIYEKLHGRSQPAIIANMLTALPLAARTAIRLYMDKLRYVRNSLNGDDLAAMGMSPGPHIKEMLGLLLEARLDGRAKNRQDEEWLVEKWLKEQKQRKG
jgi:tRNA nucleotidyltransferase (CCA-adding enzyme)